MTERRWICYRYSIYRIKVITDYAYILNAFYSAHIIILHFSITLQMKPGFFRKPYPKVPVVPNIKLVLLNWVLIGSKRNQLYNTQTPTLQPYLTVTSILNHWVVECFCNNLKLILRGNPTKVKNLLRKKNEIINNNTKNKIVIWVKFKIKFEVTGEMRFFRYLSQRFVLLIRSSNIGRNCHVIEQNKSLNFFNRVIFTTYNSYLSCASNNNTIF